MRLSPPPQELAAKVGGRGFNADASVESVAGASCGDEAGAAGSAGAAREGGEQGGEGSASYGGRGAGSVRSPEEEVMSLFLILVRLMVYSFMLNVQPGVPFRELMSMGNMCSFLLCKGEGSDRLDALYMGLKG